MDVLLVVDMQKAVFKTPRLNRDKVVSHVNTLSSRVRKQGGRVLFVQHNGTAEDDLLEGSTGWQLLDELDVSALDVQVTKTACDAFYKTDLADILFSLNARNVIIVGAATEFCVDTTLRSCLSAGFSVTAIADAHTTADRPHLPAQAIVDHHNWTWQNLIIPDVNVQVMTAAEWLS